MSQSAKAKDRPREKTKPIIYLVDDEPLLLDLAELALLHDGYTLKKFQNPGTALKTFLRSKVKPALLITDYAMGKMNGLELAEKCKQLCPELKCILISGTVGADIILNAPVKVDHFLSKPYQGANLAAIVRTVLAS